MKLCLVALLVALLGLPGRSQPRPSAPPLAPLPASPRTDSVLTAKLFPLLALFEARPTLQRALARSAALRQVAQRQARRSAPLLATPTTELPRYVDSLVWQPADIRAVGRGLQQLYVAEPAFRAEVAPLLGLAGRYPLYAALPDTAALRRAWQDAALGLNRLARVYLANARPRYPAIDSSSYPRRSAALAQLVRQQLGRTAGRTPRVFYGLSLHVGLLALRLNHRDEAARYEPLLGGDNAPAAAAVAGTNWAKFPYAAILVPGAGPGNTGATLSEMGAARCQLAAARYRAGQAPFLVVSGGHVHPFQTPICEAVEMRKYLVQTLGLPAAAVFIEPHARHTTTNMRNTVRLLGRAGVPPTLPILVVSDTAQSRYIVGMAERCRRELGYVPYRDLQPLSETESRWQGTPDALQPDPYDPLDP